MAEAYYEEYQATLQLEADEKAFFDKYHLPHQIYAGNKEEEMLRKHPDFVSFPGDLLDQRKWVQSRSCHAEKKLQDLIASKVVTNQTTITDLRKDLGGGMWYFWNYSDTVLKKHLDLHFPLREKGKPAKIIFNNLQEINYFTTLK